ncbi:hypothetical protein OAS06_02220 [Gammaproteobacteria bacterium]|nr:hypothetical protein [Gammaproteobacteria bacterium]
MFASVGHVVFHARNARDLVQNRLEFDRVIRSRSSGFWQDWFTEEDLKYYGDLFDPFLKQYGYGTVITQRESKQINPAHGSQYVKKIDNERRQREGLSTI